MMYNSDVPRQRGDDPTVGVATIAERVPFPARAGMIP